MGKLQYVCALALVVSGCGGGECEPGTTRVGDTCYPYDPFDHTPPTVTVDPPLRTRAVGTVRLTASEPAIIYYTVDGSEPTTMSPNEDTQVVLADQPDDAIVRYFAVDRAGNQSPIENATWIIDNIGPGAPRVDVQVSGTTRTVTWTPPGDPHVTGVVVARVDGVLGASPDPGQVVNVGDTISPGVTVVAVSTATTGMQTFSETMPTPPGIVRYVAWATDDVGNYGAAGGNFALVALPAQTASVHVVASSGAVTVPTPAADISLSGTATLTGSTLTVDLTVTNATTRVLFAPKILLASTLPTGIGFTPTDTFMGTPYVAYGAAIPPGVSTKRTWTFTGASSSTTLDLAVDIRNGPVIIAPHGRQSDTGDAADIDTGESVATLRPAISGPSGQITMKPGGVTPEGHVIFGSRSSGTVGTWDLATGAMVMSKELLPQKANVAAIALDRSGASGYALAAYGHAYTVRIGTIESFLVRFDTGSLRETGRIDLGSSRNRGLEISPDGHTLAIATGDPGAGTIVVDLDSFTVLRHVAIGFAPRWATFSADSKTLIVVGGSEVRQFSVADGSQTAAMFMPAGGGKVFRGDLAADGRLWVGRQNDVTAIDLATGSATSYGGTASNATVIDGKVYVGSEGGTTFQRLDNTGTSELTFNFSGDVYGHGLLRSPF
jgi:hypothetical protein